jgi:hypothetical protein
MKQLWSLTRLPDTSDRLVAGLQSHLAVSDLLVAVMRIQGQEQTYVWLDGCLGCRVGRCEPGCRTDLLQRAMRGSYLRLVPHGLRARPYHQRVLAWPTRQAQPLDGAVLAPWNEARLLIQYHPWPFGKPGTIAATALFVAEKGAPVATALRQQGWTVVPLPLHLPLYQAKGLPPSLPLGLPYPHPPLLPGMRVQSEPAQEGVSLSKMQPATITPYQDQPPAGEEIDAT